MRTLRLIPLAVLAATAGCTPLFQPAIESHPPLAPLFATRFALGAAVEPAQLATDEGRLLAWHFNSLVAENAMKPPRLQPREGEFDFGGADAIVAFAERRGMRVRGHTLLWHEETPAWFWRAPNGAAAGRERVLERLQRHIEAVVGRYRGRIDAWDVVNEVVDPAQGSCLRDDNWYRIVGPDYVEWAFRFAHAADPAARLFINDFETAEPARRDCLLGIATRLRERGVPVHGIGHQMHVTVEHPDPREVAETLRRFAALGFENQVTELDMSFYARRGVRLPGTERELLARQAARFAALFEVFRSERSLTSVTFWGISDANTWLNRRQPGVADDRPLLFDAALRPKPAYWSVVKAAGGSRR